MAARKSRKNTVEEKANRKEQICMVAGYVRLSVVKKEQPYDSIETQKTIIEQFITESSGEMLLHKIYVDEKVSGTTFECKAFQEMLTDIEKGLINCVVVKDLSRLGRNFLEAGYYIEQYFPHRSIRFVAIADEFDTTNGMTNNWRRESMSGIRIPMTNLFNEEYAEDISKKTQATIDHMIRHGKYVASRAPYGYRKNPDDCHALIVDQEAATIVKDIYAMADKGTGLNEIVRQLNTAKVLPPLEYARANGLEGNYEQGTGMWNTRSIKKILTNRVYVGDLMQGKHNHLVKGTHEALVDWETFARIQWMFSKSAEANKIKAKSVSDNLLKGKAICGCCGGKMQRRRGSGNADWHFFTCITNNRVGAGNCTGMYVRESAIMDAIEVGVAKYVEDHSNIALNYERDRRALEGKLTNAKSSLDTHIEQLKCRFEQNLRGQISEEEVEQAIAEKRIDEQEVQVIEADIAQLKQNFQLYCTFRRAMSVQSAREAIVSTYLEKATVKNDGFIEVLFSEASQRKPATV